MSKESLELLKKHLAKGTRLPDGCKLEKQCEDEPVFTPDHPVTYRHRTAHRLSGCDDPANNSDWNWGDWEEDRCPK